MLINFLKKDLAWIFVNRIVIGLAAFQYRHVGYITMLTDGKTFFLLPFRTKCRLMHRTPIIAVTVIEAIIVKQE